MRRTVCLSLLIAAAPLVWLVGRPLWGDRAFAYRDAGHYYDPLYRQTDWSGFPPRPPLWNPWENCGQPLAADPTVAVFYPGKLVFAFPLPYATCTGLYVLGHLALAFGGAWFASRRWRASRLGAALAALSYSAGGPVLFQYCNLPYLAGAAWLPWSLLAADRLFAAPRWTSAAAVGATWAMMILGGDPQSAYHAFLLALLWAFVRPRNASRRVSRPPDLPPHTAKSLSPRRSLLGERSLRLLWVAAAGVLAAGLAAVQLLPSVEYGRRTDRAVFDEPRCAWEGYSSAGWFGRPPAGTHHDSTYYFSVGPWRWAEMIWPALGGSTFPQHAHWMDLLPEEDPAWTPSLYLGLAPLILAMSGFRLWRGRGKSRFASWLIVLGIAFSLGRFGLVWFVRGAAEWLGFGTSGWTLGDQVGGPYWLAATFLPGYAMFRYPAKWLPLVSLGVALLAGKELRLVERGRIRPKVAGCLLITCAASLMLLVLTLVFSGWLAGLSQRIPTDSRYGPFQADLAVSQLRWSLAHAAILAGLTFFLSHFARTAREESASRSVVGVASGARRRFPAVPFLVLLLTAIDVCFAQSPLVQTVSSAAFHESLAAADAIHRSHRDGAEDGSAESSAAPVPPRVFRQSPDLWDAKEFDGRSSPDRLAEGLRWDRATLLPKHHLGLNLSLVETAGQAASADLEALLDLARQRAQGQDAAAGLPRRELLDFLGAEFLLLPSELHPANLVRLLPEKVEPHAASLPPDAALWRNSRAYPRAFLVRRVVQLTPLATRRRSALRERTEEVFFPSGKLRPLLHEAVIESDLPLDLPLANSVGAPSGGTAPTAALPLDQSSRCRIVAYSPGRIELDVSTPEPALLVVGEGFDPAWRAEIFPANGDAPPKSPAVLRTDRVFCGVLVPSGEARIVLQYRPPQFAIGAAISFLSWIALAALLVIRVAAVARPRRIVPRH